MTALKMAGKLSGNRLSIRCTIDELWRFLIEDGNHWENKDAEPVRCSLVYGEAQDG